MFTIIGISIMVLIYIIAHIFLLSKGYIVFSNEQDMFAIILCVFDIVFGVITFFLGTAYNSPDLIFGIFITALGICSSISAYNEEPFIDFIRYFFFFK